MNREETRMAETNWSSLGYLVYKRTYARKLDPFLGADSPTEEFEDTIERVLDACREQLQCNFTDEEEDRLRHYWINLKSSVAGRFLWQLMSDTVADHGLGSLQNCAGTLVDEPIRPFVWTMDMLMLGAGVGYNIQRRYVNKLPEVTPWFKPPERFDDGGADYIVPDSREGWVKLLGKTLKAAFLSDSPESGFFTYSTQVIRPAGSVIKKFGGTASGPEHLVWGINEIAKILYKRRGDKLTPVDCLDIMNIIGAVVVSGNVRRSAQLAIGDPDDVEYLMAKRWDLGNIPSWRAMSNNSVAANNIHEIHSEFWEGYKRNPDGSAKGECYGLINLELSRKVGRLGETEYPDPGVVVYNP